MEPLVLQMYEEPDLRVIDLESLGAGGLSALSVSRPRSQWLFVRETARLTADDTERYSALPCLLSQQLQPLNVQKYFEIDLIEHPQSCRQDTSDTSVPDLITR